MFKIRALHIGAMLVLASVGITTPVLAQDKDQDRVQLRDQDQIYGSQRMTQQERDEYRNRTGAMKTEQEREAYRLEHRIRMQERERDRMHDKGAQRHDAQILKPGMGAGGGAGKGR